MARGVNARLTSRRKRVWSGGSTTSIDGGSATPVASSSSPKRSAHRISRGATERSHPTPKRSERRTSEATACEVVTSPRLLADERAAGAQLLVHRVRLVADGRVAEQPAHRVAAADAPVEEHRREPVPHAPADDGPGRTQGGGRDPFRDHAP